MGVGVSSDLASNVPLSPLSNPECVNLAFGVEAQTTGLGITSCRFVLQSPELYSHWFSG